MRQGPCAALHRSRVIIHGDNDILTCVQALSLFFNRPTPHILSSCKGLCQIFTTSADPLIPSDMKTTFTRSAAAAALVKSASAILVTSGSSCDQQCGNVLSATTPADIVCDQSNYGSAAGVVFENCLNCEITSTYYTTNPNQSDQQWMLYNSRYALSECLFGEPGNESVGSSPCTTS